jgi:mannose-6-phosphate isomerase
VALYPLLLEPIYKEKVWGGRALERFHRTLPGGAETTVGESWELADLDETSPSGGGGGAAHTRIRNGPLRERTLRDVVRDFGGRVTGRIPLSPVWGFPLLIKYLDARENVSVQVHPSPAYAADHPEAHLKSEAWYVVDAEPGAKIYKGLREDTTSEDFFKAAADGTIEELMLGVPAEPGSCHFIPSGTCHALGAGVLVAEVQTPSDTTFRIFDWGRSGREMHLAQALECVDLGPVDARAFEPGSERTEDGATVRHVVECEHFGIHHWALGPARGHTFASGACEVLMVVRGSGVLRWGKLDHELAVRAGDTVLLPAALASAELRATGALEALQITIPEVPEEDR